MATDRPPRLLVIVPDAPGTGTWYAAERVSAAAVPLGVSALLERMEDALPESSQEPPIHTLGRCARSAEAQLEALLHRHNVRSGDALFIWSAGLPGLLGLAAASQRLRDAMPRTVVRFCESPDGMAASFRASRSTVTAFVRQAVADLFASPAGDRVRLFAPTRGLADEYCELTRHRVQIAPIPAVIDPPSPRPRTGVRVLCVARAANATATAIVQRLARELGRRGVDGDVVLHQPQQSRTPATADWGPFEFERHLTWLSEPKYSALLASTSLVLFLTGTRAGESAGTFADVTAMGLPVIVPDESWMADEIAEAGRGTTYDESDLDKLPDIIEATLRRLPALTSRALVARTAARRQHDPQRVGRFVCGVALLDAARGTPPATPVSSGPSAQPSTPLVADLMARVAEDLLRAGDCVFDVGANVGAAAKAFGTKVGPTGRVHAFEANPRTFASLSARVRHAGNLVPIHAAVLNESSDTISFYLDERPGMAGVASSVFPEWPRPHVANHASLATRVAVPALTLDEYARHHRLAPALIKLDIEGAEALALRGAHSLLADTRPHILLEYFGPGDGRQDTSLHMLEAAGYALFDSGSYARITANTAARGRRFFRDVLAIHTSRIAETPYAHIRRTTVARYRPTASRGSASIQDGLTMCMPLPQGRYTCHVRLSGAADTRFMARIFTRRGSTIAVIAGSIGIANWSPHVSWLQPETEDITFELQHEGGESRVRLRELHVQLVRMRNRPAEAA